MVNKLNCKTIPQSVQAKFEKSAEGLKKILDTSGKAQNTNSAWGYSPYPIAKRLSTNQIEITTYHFEDEYETAICETEAETIEHLYSDDEDNYWTPGSWTSV